MDAKGTLINGWSDLKDAFLDLIIATWWIVALIISLPFLYLMVDENGIRILEIFMNISKPILIALMAMFAFKVLLRRKEIKVEITTSKFLVYMLASFFVGLAVSIGYMIFIIPGLIFLALSVFVPIFILYKNQGPIESIASSSSHMEGDLFKQTVLFSILWLIPAMMDYLIGYVTKNWFVFSVISNISFIITAYYIYSISVSLFLTVEQQNEIRHK